MFGIPRSPFTLPWRFVKIKCWILKTLPHLFIQLIIIAILIQKNLRWILFGYKIWKVRFLSCTISSEKIRRSQKKRLRKSAQKKSKPKRHCTICGSENHNRQRYDQEPDADSDIESARDVGESAGDAGENDDNERRSSLAGG